MNRISVEQNEMKNSMDKFNKIGHCKRKDQRTWRHNKRNYTETRWGKKKSEKMKITLVTCGIRSSSEMGALEKGEQRIYQKK